jgi:poly-gamma-glutamate synthesis protein (capsule biosynthesis protein)
MSPPPASCLPPVAGSSMSTRSPDADAPRGVIIADDVVVSAFARIGWKWGGVWNEADYQHVHAH